MKKIYSLLVLGCLICLADSAFAQPVTTSFGYTGSVQTYTVPLTGVSQLYVDAVGGMGGLNYIYSRPGFGGRVQCIINVTGGEVLNVYVGQQGQGGTSSCCLTYTGGLNSGGGANGGNGYGYGGGGGAETDIRIGGTAIANRAIVAGGGGGACYDYGTVNYDRGGDGGGTTGEKGWGAGSNTGTYGGGGGTSAGGGAAATYSCLGSAGDAAGVGVGGNVATGCYSGGGGGGYHGGGAGSWGGGGGGSSYTDNTQVVAASVVHTQGSNNVGSGYVTITTLTTGGTGYAYTGAVQTYTVPAGVTTVAVDVIGARGGCDDYWPSYTSAYYSEGGAGGRVTATLNVTPLSVLDVYVGGAGGNGACNGGTYSSGAAGYNGGGATGGPSAPYAGGGGGGASDIRVTPYATGNRIVVAGGGGGAGLDNSGAPNKEEGGAGGGLTGQNGFSAGSNTGTVGGQGGGPGGGGAAGSGGGTAGGPAQGGTGYGPGAAGGGGGGYYGGGGGGTSWSGGGGGSSFTDPAYAVSGTVTHTQGYNQNGGGGMVLINPLCKAPGTNTGTATVCMGSTTTLSNVVAVGGTWYSTNSAIATVGSTTGVVTGVLNGTVTIIDSIASPCGGLSARTIVTVNAVPSAISGSLNTCIGTTATVSNTFGGGTWTSSTPGVATVGTSSGIVAPVTSGTTTLTYNLNNGCSTVTAVFTVNPLPVAIGGTLSVCSGLTTNLTDGSGGGSWTSGNTGLATVGSSSGVVTGVAGVSGSVNITYTLPTGCLSSSPLTVNNLSPITGTASICMGYTTSLADAAAGGNWSSSNVAIGTVNSSGLVSGLALGSTTISYNIPANGCTATQSVIVVGPAVPMSVTGGGSVCPGGTVTVGMAGSGAGTLYQLYNGSAPVGSPITGAGFAFSFPPVSAAGTYSVVGGSGACAASMTGSAIVNIYPLPTKYTVSATNGGAYCAGGSGVHIFLSSSQVGVNYQLVNVSTPVGAPISGTGAALDFGAQTTLATYMITATNATTTCNDTMANTVTLSTTPLPTQYPTGGGGGYCTGTSGVNITLSNSATGVNYQLLLAGVPVVSVPSQAGNTGFGLSFGPVTTAGTYSIVATNATTGCSSTMLPSSTNTVTVNALPTVFTVTGGGAYCTGGTGSDIQLNGSQSGVQYQLYRGAVSLGSTLNPTGTGAALDYGLQSIVGSYTVVANNPVTGCGNNMTGSANVSTNPLPTTFTVSADAPGNFCAGGTGLHLRLSGSAVGTNYFVYNGSTLAGPATSGTGGALDFGALVPGVTSTYSVSATNVSTGCAGGMSGTATITVNSLPTVYNVTVTGGGAYCAGGAGQVIGLSGSQAGVSYQLYKSGVILSGVAPVVGTSSAISFPAQTATGSYTVVATNASTCTANMSGSALISINPLPVVYNLTGGGAICASGTGLHINLSASDLGVRYQLNNGGPIGGPVSGIGTALDFGAQTTGGAYSVTATNNLTGCTSTMSGTPAIVVNPAPVANTVTASNAGIFCAGTLGDSINLGGSVTGTNYQLLRGTTAVGSAVAGTGAPVTFGLQNVSGTYTVVGVVGSTGCIGNMTGSAILNAHAVPAPFNVTGGGAYCAGTSGSAVSLSSSSTGIKYRLYNTAGPVGSAVNGTGFGLSFGNQTVASTYTVIATDTTALGCTNNMAGSVNVSISALPNAYPVNGGGPYCAGGSGVSFGLNNSDVGVNYQAMVGSTAVGTLMPGTGSSLNFGLMTTGGAYTVMATSTATGCTNTMTGTENVVVNAAPAPHNVMGGGNYCPGGTGVTITLDGSNSGIIYQLFNGASVVGSAATGTGTGLTFGPVTGTGTYTIVASNTSTGCTGSMTGNATVGISATPTLYNVTGTSNYCPGGAGVHVGLNGSSSGDTYQLYNSGGFTVGSAFTGTGVALDFGVQTAGNYTVVATGIGSTCAGNMNGSAVVGLNPLPATHNITGGGNYCTGGVGVHIGLNGSDANTWYQLRNGVTNVGSPMAGTGAALDFGLQSGGGTYTVLANSAVTTCTNTMAGSANVGVNAPPAAFAVTGGGAICPGGPGTDVSLSGSAVGVNYQLYNGSATSGVAVSGTGTSISFGPQTAAGTYMVVATNGSSSCTNSMTGNAVITMNAAPTAYSVTGGGSFCATGTGVHVSLGGSDIGTQYQLLNGGVPVPGVMTGTGSGLDFGLQTAGGNYTVSATNLSTTCAGNMSGSVNVIANASPTAYTVTASGSSYCAGGSGIGITLSGSDIGTSYQLFEGTMPVGGTVAGTSAALDFGRLTATGTYTVHGINSTTGCVGNMGGSASVSISPLPVAFTVTGGGHFCTSGTGVPVELTGSNVGVNYQLMEGTTPVGGLVAGTGGGLNFGLQTTEGSYTVMATNPATSCFNHMAGNATVTVDAPPAAYNVTGGGSYCASGSGVHVGLNGSVPGTTYQLMNGTLTSGSAMAGTGSSLDFGSVTGAGIYSVMASSLSTTCSANMTGTVAIVVNPLPTPYILSDGGNYCPGGTGVAITLSNSASGISYQLYNGTATSGPAMTGTGTGLSFGMATIAGNYTVKATNPVTTCSAYMTGSAPVVVNTLPAAYNVTGGGSFCSGTSGVHIGLNNSAPGISYQAWQGFTAMGSPVIGTGSTLDLGPQTTSGTYTVVASDLSTTCINNMTGTATVNEITSVIPAVSITNGTTSDVLCSGVLTNFTAVTSNGGVAPVYQWTVNGITVGSANHYSYVAVNGDVIGVAVTSDAQCASPSTVSNSMGLTVNAQETPAVTISSNAGSEVCQGTAVQYTATPVAGGAAPVYSWIKNGSNVSSSASYTYVPSNNDNVYVIMSSNYQCRTANTATSNKYNMTVDVAAVPTVSIAAQPGTGIASGQTAVFTATASNGGPTPTFQWFVNGVAQPGATFSVFVTSNLNNFDSVSCEVTSSGGCSGMVGESSVVMHVANVGVKNIVGNNGSIVLVPNPNNGQFTLKGNLGITTDEQVTLEVTNMLGQVIYTTQVLARGGDINERIQLNGSVANGMYILNMHSDSGTKVFHMVIEQ